MNVVQQLLARRSARGPIELEELEGVLDRSAAIATTRQAALLRDEIGARAQSADIESPVPAGRRAGVDSRAERRDPVEAIDAARSTAALAPSEVALALDLHAPAVVDVGVWVVEQLRNHGFNLRAAAMRLSRLRRLGATRAVVPVFDRGAIDYHLCGEFMRRLVAHGFEVEDTLADLAGRRDWVPRLRRKVRAYLRPLAESAGDRQQLERRFDRIPERYRDDVRAALDAWAAGKWKLP